MNVAVYGASTKEKRYAYMAVRDLLEKGHKVYPIHPRLREVLGQKVYTSLAEIEDEIHTLTMYVGPARQVDIIPDILAKDLKRVIFNPGTENEEFEKQLSDKGVEPLEACTLVMLRTEQFDV